MNEPTPEQRAEMAAYVDEHQPGLLDDLGIPRTTESHDSVEDSAAAWWAEAFPQWKGHGHESQS